MATIINRSEEADAVHVVDGRLLPGGDSRAPGPLRHLTPACYRAPDPPTPEVDRAGASAAIGSVSPVNAPRSAPLKRSLRQADELLEKTAQELAGHHRKIDVRCV